MSPSVNQFSDVPESADASQSKPLNIDTPDGLNVTESTPPVESEATEPVEAAMSEATKNRQHPIPPPSEPMQYRAIGLVRGRYESSPEQFTRGTLYTPDGTSIDAVLLGRVMSLVKNHLSLEQEHLWVVYPRMRQNSDQLHVQIVGVWEPEKLHPATPDVPDEATETPISASDVTDGYFSIRGEVIFQAQEDKKIIIKIKQSPRKDEETPKFFKLQLTGDIDIKAVGHFMDLQVQRQGNDLVIQESTDIGRIPPRKPVKKKFAPKRGGYGGGKRPGTGGQYSPRPRPSGERSGDRTGPTPPPKRRDPLPKPVKKRNPPPEA